MQENPIKKSKENPRKKHKENKRQIASKLKANLMKWVSVKHIEKESLIKHLNFRDLGGGSLPHTVDRPTMRGRQKGLGIYFDQLVERSVLCVASPPDYFLADWVRRNSPARVVQGGLVGTPGLATYFVYKWCMRWFMRNRMFVQCVLGFRLVLTTGCQNLCLMTPFKYLPLIVSILQGNDDHQQDHRSYFWDKKNKVRIPPSKEDQLCGRNLADFRLIKKTTQTSIEVSSSQPDNEESKDNESYGL
ncbi:hypothetical protein M9H77_11712 [Catharanthus roseus]|uniref:Uncharacterized protein n=1 Tax=Catharanthus roseus TaxID=4058 RepID=A0ACC0BFJ1_CATRO|nr:hypothetical protein M9H77_11712 [Catharanthus roseus]